MGYKDSSVEIDNAGFDGSIANDHQKLKCELQLEKRKRLG